MKSIESIVDKLHLHLPQERIDHSIRVAELSQSLARRYQQDDQAAYLAGLWHDIAKDESPESLRGLGIAISKNLESMYQEYPKIFHAFAGPLLARHYAPDLSSEILQAMTWHTTGKGDMSSLEKIVFIADYCEPGRRERDLKPFLASANESLDKAVSEIMIATIAHLHSQRRKIHPFSLQCYNSYL